MTHSVRSPFEVRVIGGDGLAANAPSLDALTDVLGPSAQGVWKRGKGDAKTKIVEIPKPGRPSKAPGRRSKGPIEIVVTVGDPSQAWNVIDLVERYGEQLSRQQDSAEKIVEALVPEGGMALKPAQVAQLARSAETLSSIEEEFGFYTGPMIGKLAGSTAENRSATAARWRGNGRIFAISRPGGFNYPAFQFTDNGQPKEVVARVIHAFGEAGDSGWVLGSWFVALNSYLADETTSARRPVDVMDTDPNAVVAAAGAALDGGP